jgi:hypothetical protein
MIRFNGSIEELAKSEENICYASYASTISALIPWLICFQREWMEGLFSSASSGGIRRGKCECSSLAVILSEKIV